MVHIIAAIYSEGFHHPDEHFQILEFSNYKLGNSAAEDLPWEFAARERSALQPVLGMLMIKMASLIGIENPFHQAFLIRLISGLLGWYIMAKLSLLLMGEFSTPKGQKMFIIMTQTLWFIPYVNVRFSSEVWAAMALLAGLYLILLGRKKAAEGSQPYFAGAGFLLGLSFFFRFQMGLALLGLGLWLIFSFRASWPQIGALVISGLVAISLCILIDSWVYGVPALTPWTYYDWQLNRNFIGGAAASPWWNYILLTVVHGIPPLSLVLVLLFFLGIYLRPSSPFLWIMIPFVIVHMSISHKEIRYMFPMIFGFIYLAAIGLDYLLKRYPDTKAFKYTYRGLLPINLIFLVLAIFIPAQEAIVYYRNIYRPVGEERIPLLALDESPYELVGLETNFYKPRDARTKVFRSYDQMEDYLRDNNLDQVLVLSREPELGHEFRDFKKERVFSLFPEWLLNIKFINWQKRARTWSIYRIFRE